MNSAWRNKLACWYCICACWGSVCKRYMSCGSRLGLTRMMLCTPWRTHASVLDLLCLMDVYALYSAFSTADGERWRMPIRLYVIKPCRFRLGTT